MVRICAVVLLMVLLPYGCVSFWPMGCYESKDVDGRKVLDLILTERDQTSNVYGNRMIDWLQWNDYMPGFVCRCAQEAKRLGYNVFGIEYFSECHAQQLSEDRKRKLKTSTNGCVGENFSPCDKQKFCVGKANTVMMYELAVSFRPMGCYESGHANGNPVMDLILTERDQASHVYGNRLIDWNAWNDYMPGFIGRCAQEAKRLGYKDFGIEYYGECRAGPLSDDTKSNLTASPYGCEGMDFTPCDQQRFCVGKASRIMMYEFADTECSVSYVRIGCFSYKQQPPCLLPLNDRHLLSPGHSTDVEHAPDLLCRCAQEAQANGWGIFGVQNQGECLKGPGGQGPMYFSNGDRIQKCTDQCDADCGYPISFSSTGQTYSNAVYVLVGGASGEGSGAPCIPV